MLRNIFHAARYAPKASPMSFAAATPNHILAPIQHCYVCNETIGAPRADDLVEKAAVLPCSHIFGDICISRWLEIDSSHQDCPICRRRMIYRECGHTIKPCGVEHAPSCVEEKDMPKRCFACRGGGLIAEVLVLMDERRLAEERVLQGLRKHVSGFFGEMCGTTVDSVDERIEEVRGRWKSAADSVCSELEEVEGRDQW